MIITMMGAYLRLQPKPLPPSGHPYVVSVFSGKGLEPGLLNTPRSVAQDGKGTCYVLDLSDRIQAFDVETGKFLRLWHLPEIKQGRPERILWDAGSLLVTDTHYGRILRYDPEGKLLKTFGEEGKEPGQLHYPTAIRVLNDRRIAVTEYGGHDRIQFFTPEGKCLGGFGKGGTGPGEFMRPQGIVQGPDSNLYVADAANQRVQVFTPEGKLVRIFGEAGIARGKMSYPYDLAFDSKGRLLVLEYGAHRISFWSPEGQWLGDLGSLGTKPGELANPWGLCLLPDGTVLVTNSENHRIEHWRLP